MNGQILIYYYPLPEQEIALQWYNSILANAKWRKCSICGRHWPVGWWLGETWRFLNDIEYAFRTGRFRCIRSPVHHRHGKYICPECYHKDHHWWHNNGPCEWMRKKHNAENRDLENAWHDFCTYESTEVQLKPKLRKRRLK